MKPGTVGLGNSVLGVKARPVLRLDLSHSANGVDCSLCGGTASQAIRRLAHQGLSHRQSRL